MQIVIVISGESKFEIVGWYSVEGDTILMFADGQEMYFSDFTAFLAGLA